MDNDYGFYIMDMIVIICYLRWIAIKFDKLLCVDSIKEVNGGLARIWQY